MNITTQDRTALKAYFVSNSIPTQRNFADLIDGMLNLKEDGLAKPAGSPLSIEASGDGDTSQKRAINFYNSFGNNDPDWVLSLKPRSDPGVPTSGREGFSIGNSAGHSRLFIDKTSGNVGIGTVSPGVKLEVDGDIRSGNALISDNPHGVAHAAFSHKDQGTSTGYALLQYSDGTTYLNAPTGKSVRFRINNADKMRLTSNGNVGIGTNAPVAKLQVVGGAIMPSAGNNSTAGIMFPENAGGGSSDKGWIRYYARSGENMTLELGTANDTTDHIALVPSGNVGIGTNNPTKAKLVVSSNGLNNVEKGQHYYIGKGGTGSSIRFELCNAIWAEGDIACVTLRAFSDARIKNVIGTSDGARDLDTMNRLQVTDYTYIDAVQNGDQPHKKLIAQEVRSVYPSAIHASADFVPNIYTMSAAIAHDGDRTLAITLKKDHGLAIGDTVRLMDGEEIRDLKVLDVPHGKRFMVESDTAPEKVFVYGSLVDDFLTIDYDAIAMLNVSATQELARRCQDQEARIEKLEGEVAWLKKT
uniref:Chaperone of endosialidase n=1 Tax=Candidatus Kentrum sp. UNK TaxID=2126344 RepID=A0A451ARV6_9GAMM|nr:MAG: Chaperone of endosialidase [Candidatus Kentron sp. UNK]VFK68763.1 MAG: Chaperone of endosialidase [Candidatus Kentron sp. UNK]